MNVERSVTRRRFVALTGTLGVALAGCMDDEGGESGENGENGEEGNGSTDGEDSGEGENDDGGNDGNGDDENGEQDPSEGDEPPNVEGTNVFVRVVDEEETAIEGATVTITGGEFDGEEFETGPDGRVIQQGVEPGEYTVTASTDEAEDEAAFTLEEGDDKNLTFELPVPSGEDE